MHRIARTTFAKLRNGLSHTGGNIASITALTLPMIVGFCGLGADVGYWYFENRNLQAAADVAAYDGAVALSESDTSTQVTSAATTGANANNSASIARTVTVNDPPTSGTHQNTNSVEVIVKENVPRFFSAIFSSSPISMTARAVATETAGGSACILALNPTGNNVITDSGSGDIDSSTCDVVSDSSSSSAIDMSGSGKITAACLVAVGQSKTTSGLTLDKCTGPTNGAAYTPDPYASVPAPTASGSCLTVPSGTNITLNYGDYCSGLTIPAGVTATFNPGTYYVNGNFTVSGGGSASGSGVTIYITSGHTAAVSGSSTTNLSAPTSGTYSGILFFGSRSGTTSSNNNFSGASSSNLTGVLYFPTQDVTFSGGSSTGTNCTQIVGYNVTVSGMADLSGNCPGDGMSNIAVADGSKSNVSLVE